MVEAAVHETGNPRVIACELGFWKKFLVEGVEEGFLALGEEGWIGEMQHPGTDRP